ncbi:MAG: S9 family peptidase [Actinomycetota bacterium]|nr:MAG: S9 family peptidase [Actinomycetota bacterium]
MTAPAPSHHRDVSDSYPRQRARTRSFRLGAPTAVTVSADGSRVLFCRSVHGTDPVNRLWALEVPATGPLPPPRCVADPTRLLAGDGEQLPAAERARRERVREVAAGITTYAVDRAGRQVTFALSGVPWVVDLDSGEPPRALPAPGPVLDPRPDPTGQQVAFVSDRGLYVADLRSGELRELARPDTATQTWGLADFLAAEELGRTRGFWWSPDGSHLLVQLTDESAVATWWIADPARPELPATAHRYPAAGATNPQVSLWLFDSDGGRREIEWDVAELPYLVEVHWGEHGDPLLTAMSRDQRRVVTYRIDPRTATATAAAERHDRCWVELVAGVPQLVAGGRLLDVTDDNGNDTRRLTLDGVALTPPGLQIRAVLGCTDDAAIVSATTEPVDTQLVRVGWDGTVTPLTEGPGWRTARAGAAVLVVSQTTLDTTATTTTVRRHGVALGDLDSYAETPVISPAVTLVRSGSRALRTAVLFPRDHTRGSRRLPAILSPYGGPHAQRVVASGLSFGTEQWIADQGFVVVVADGRGTPGRGPAWERGVYRDLATPVLDDQVAALDSVLASYPDDVDPDRVGIRGWSFGGYLAALAVLRRPDRFHAAVAGAPVTDWRLYDSCYTERYLGHPADDPEPYERTSLLPIAAQLRRPLLLVHGLADDNVVAAHTLQLSAALLAAGREHSVLPLSGVTHMTPQEVVAENLLRLEIAFFGQQLAAG